MELTVREAATLLGRSPRTVRSQVARGELPGVKRDGRWRIERRDLPLSEPQRRRFQRRADSLRQTLEAALPSRLARTPGQKGRSIADLDAFRLGAEVLGQVRSADGDVLPERQRARVTRRLEQGLLALAEAVEQYDREAKLSAVGRARGALAQAVALLLLEAGTAPAEPVAAWVAALEGEVIPAVAGFARWAERLGRRPR